MNFLAHIYLSGDNDQLKVGNFMADPIKGSDYKKYPGDYRRGIILHRKIDSFTDAHPIVHQSTRRLFEKFRHYNGVINDVFYDHFLAKNWKNYHRQDLADYIQDFYALLDDDFEILPQKIQNFLPYMKSQNWLLSYKNISGIEKILGQMSARIKGDFCLNEGIDILKNNYEDYENEFTSFFEEIQHYVSKELPEI